MNEEARKRAAHTRVPLPEPSRANQRWSMDFVSDRLADGCWFRILTVVDQYTRECLCIYADRSQTGEKVVGHMKRLVAVRGVPESITTDNSRGRRWTYGRIKRLLRWTLFGPAGPSKTATLKASTDDSGTNA